MRRHPCFLLTAGFIALGPFSQVFVGQVGAADDPGSPDSPVKLVFVYHSCGANWLSDTNGSGGVFNLPE